MIKVTIGQTLQRKDVMVEETKTINEIIRENDVPTTGVTYHLDGVPLSADELDTPIGELVDSDSTMLSVVVAQKAGC